MADFLRTLVPETTVLGAADPTPNTVQDVAPLPTLQDEGTQEKAVASQAPGAFAVLGAAFTTETVAPTVASYLGTTGYDLNVDWLNQRGSLDEGTRRELNFAGRPPEMVADIITNSVSKEHALAMASAQDERLKAEDILNRSGAGGIAARLVATLLDPTAIAVTVATDGFAAPLVIGTKATRLGRAIKTGLLAGASNAAIAQTMTSFDPMRDEKDVAIAAAAGFGLGAIIGAASHVEPNDLMKVFNSSKETLAKNIETHVTIHDTSVDAHASNMFAMPADDADLIARESAAWKVKRDAATTARILREPSVRVQSIVDLNAFKPVAVRSTEIVGSNIEPGLSRTAHYEAPASEAWRNMFSVPAASDDAVAVTERTVQTLQKFDDAAATAKQGRTIAANAAAEGIPAKPPGLGTEVPTNVAPDVMPVVPKMGATSELPGIMPMPIRFGETQAILPGAKVMGEVSEYVPVKQLERRMVIPDEDGVPTIVYADVLRPGETMVPSSALKIEVPATTAPVADGAAVVDELGGSVGAHANPNVEINGPERLGPAQTKWKKFRSDARDFWAQFDIAALLGRAEHDGHSWFGRQLVDNPSGVNKYTGRPQGRTVVTDKEMIHKEVAGEAFRNYNASYAKWAEENGRKFAGYNPNARREFGTAVGLEIRSPSVDASEAVKQAAQTVRDFHAKYAAMAKEAKMAGFEDLIPDGRYMTRVVNHDNFIQLEREIGTMQMRTLLAHSMMNAPGRKAALEFDEAERMAFLYVRYLKNSAYETSTGMAPAFNGGLINKLRDNLIASLNTNAEDLEDVAADAIRRAISVGDVDALIDSVKNVGQAGVISRGKFRIAMDEAYTMKIGGRDVSMSQFLENDAERLMLKYSSEMSGAVALARHPELNIKSMSHWEQLMTDLKDTAPTKVRNMAKYQKEAQAIELIRRHLFGQPMHDMTARNSALFRIVRDWNFTRLGNKFGFSQIPEFGNMLGQVGFQAMIPHMPVLTKIMRDVKTGKFDSELIDTIDAWGIGIDRQLGHPSVRDLDAMDSGSRVLGKIEDGLSVAKRVTSDFSGLGVTTDLFERLAAIAAIQKFANMAKGGSKLSKQRLESMGLTTDDAERVFAQMRKHVNKTEGGIEGRKVSNLNFADWDAPERELFKTAIWRWSRRMIQRNDIGDTALFMSNPVAQLLFQFRNFTLVAHAKQLLHGVRMGDAETVTSFLGSTLMGGLGYMALVHTNAIGRADRDAYLEKNLTMQKIGMMGFARSGFSSLVPSAADTGLLFMGEDSVFSQSRTTGISADYIFGAPAIDLATTGVKVAQSATAPFRSDYSYSQQDARALKQMLPFQNMAGISNGIEFLIRDLPKKSTY
ncbi:hypothetical protein UFOVP823_26 [uncultured Caudovirales phage]|uniref:Uncharacterized protein n=1 Tax=uncultured Caudovirales phage TaxID=2100421 RepID=A0A6J5P890_9CAUD|nr:hypothetical protein UFOVP823_26 [uncultured Caudovirales phage]